MKSGDLSSTAPNNFMRRLLFIFFDIISFCASIFLSFGIKGEFTSSLDMNQNFVIILLTFITVKLFIFFSFKLYDISWRYVSLQDLANISKACLLSNGIIFIIVYGFNISAFSGFPKTVLLTDLVLTFLFSSGFKISKRMYLEVMRQSIRNSDLKRTLIIGAGSSGEQLLRDINRSHTRKFLPIGFIDDDPSKQNLYYQGVRALGNTDQLSEIIKKYNIDTVLISVLTADRNFHRKILNLSRDAGVKNIKVLASVNDVSNSTQIGVNDIRDIDVSDLIGRQAVSINTKVISGYLKNKRVLISGAAGSIGAEISRQVTFYEPNQIAIVDINESDLADLEIQLKRLRSNSEIKMYLCDISNKSKVEKMFEDFMPDVVFHAAAYKHVPVMEKFPEEAVRVNIIGTHILSKASSKFGVENFILISTDKAVNPTSIMGASKRIAEYIVTGIGKGSASRFVAVRFGNVIGSRGSALPIFIDQLKHGGPITITHPEMKRYFMTIPEAVALVLQAAATGKNGDVFILDMGEPIKIVDLATELILLNNLIPGKDIKIEFTGIREGEKLFEEVLTAEEGVIETSHEKILKSRLVCMHNEESIDTMVEEFNSILNSSTKEDWIEILKYYIPQFNPSNKIDQFDTESAAMSL